MADAETITAAAQHLGAPELEVLDVVETDAGDVIHMFDGSSYIVVDKPDAEGKTGLMYLTKPTDTYNGSFPVFAGAAPDAPHPQPVVAPVAPAPAAVEVEPGSSGPVSTPEPATAPAAPPPGGPVPLKPPVGPDAGEPAAGES